jgi:predicted  nucleic acid-binding Zn-ribbon protein
MSKKEITVEDKLRMLYDLQLIESELDKIRNVRGELPLEVEDLEDEIEGMKTRVEKMEADIKEQDDAIKAKKQLIKECQVKIAKYEEQQKNVRNNREFDAISKEMEFQDLEIQLAEKRIKEHKFQLEQKTAQSDEVKEKLQSRVDHLNHKKAELDTILEETKAEEEALLKVSAGYSKKLDERLLKAYRRIRDNSRNGLAVVAVDRGASGGSFFTIPPQRQMEIAARRKIITDEHSGRILVDPELAAEERERMNGLFKELVG